MAIKIKAVFFDLDETILDRTESLKDFAVWQAQEMFRNSIADTELFCSRFIQLDARGFFDKAQVYAQLIEEFHINDWSASELVKCYELCFSGVCKAKPGVVEALHVLHSSGVKLGLVSNGNSPFQQQNLTALGIAHLFDAVIVSAAVGYRKPERQIFELACRSLDVLPSEAAFVGDNPSADIDGANSVGMYTVYIPGHYGQTYTNADAICSDFTDLAAILEDAICSTPVLESI